MSNDQFQKKLLKKPHGWLCLPALLLCACTQVSEHCSDHNALDRSSQFCFENAVVDKCGGKAYDPPTEFCHVGAVYKKCNGNTYTPPNNPCDVVTTDPCVTNPGGPDCCTQTPAHSSCPLPTYTLTTDVFPADGGTVTRNPNQTTYDAGTSVTVTAAAAAGYTFAGWSGASTSTSAAATVTMNSNQTLTAIFQQQGSVTHILATEVSPTGGGSVSRNPDQTSYNAGTTVTVTAAAAAGYEFTGWSGVSSSTSTSVTITMDGNKTLTANFQQQQATTYTLSTSVTPTGGGTVSRNPDQTSYNAGTTVTVTAAAATGYEFTGWSGVSSSTSPSVTITMDGNKTLTANFASSGGGSTVTDSRDGKTYRTVKIGTQTWMAENLNYSGHQLGNSWCYDDSPDNCAKYGRLYDWAAVMNGSASTTANPSGVQGICPSGWHVPSRAEWIALVDYAGGSTVAGKKLKSSTGWNGTDDFVFSALPGGYRSGSSFLSVGSYGYWWNATGYNLSDAYCRRMFSGSENVSEFNNFKTYGYSVRCLKD